MALSIAKVANYLAQVDKARAVVGRWPAQFETDDERLAYKVQDAFLKKQVVKQGPLYADPAQHGLTGIGERDHESIALILDHVAAVVVDKLSDELVVPLKQLHPVPVAKSFIEHRRILDIGEGNHDLAVGRQPGQIGTLYLCPAREIFD